MQEHGWPVFEKYQLLQWLGVAAEPGLVVIATPQKMKMLQAVCNGGLDRADAA
jgi:hypothetical protein